MSTRRWGRGAGLGQATVEYALVVVPFFLLVFGIFDLGRGVFFRAILGHAAHEAARVGSVAGRSADEICATAFAAAALPGVPLATACGVVNGAQGHVVTVEVVQRGVAGDPSAPLQVSLTYSFRPAAPLVGVLVGSPVMLVARSLAYVES